MRTADYCGFCLHPMDTHYVATEPVRLPDGREAVKAVSWACPTTPAGDPA